MSIINAGCIGEGPCWEDLHPDEAAEIAWRIRAEENTIPIVDLNEIKPVQFNKTQVYDELNRINNGGVINPATVIKMLKQLHHIMTETIPPRNCDRPECATTKAAQEVWRKEDGGKMAYYEWLLAASTKGEAK